MDTTAMRKLPNKEIWSTIDSMKEQLYKAHEELSKYGYKDNPTMYIGNLVKIRTLSDEIIRWLVL